MRNSRLVAVVLAFGIWGVAAALAVAQQDTGADPGPAPRQEKNLAEDLGAFGEFLFGSKPVKPQNSGATPATQGPRAPTSVDNGPTPTLAPPRATAKPPASPPIADLPDEPPAESRQRRLLPGPRDCRRLRLWP